MPLLWSEHRRPPRCLAGSTPASSVLACIEGLSFGAGPRGVGSVAGAVLCLGRSSTVARRRRKSESPGCAGISGDARRLRSRRTFDWTSARHGAIGGGMNFEPASPGTSPGASAGTSTCASPSNPSLRPRPQTECHLRALGFADISADNHDGYGFLRSASLSIPCAPLALGACAIASALATQRLSLAPPRSHSLAAARCGANRGSERAGSVSRGGHPSGRPCGHPSGRFALRPKGGFLAALGRLRALRFADIPTSPKGRCMSSVRRSHSFTSELPLAPFALGAIAIASALAPQRFSAKPRGRRPAAAWCGAVGGPLLACLAMARGREDCQERRRPRSRAQSARVMAVHRKEVDLDRFVAALLALAADPGRPHSGRRHKSTGELLRLEQTCRQR